MKILEYIRSLFRRHPQSRSWAPTAEQEFGDNVRYVIGVYADFGEVVICENGHAICEFVKTVNVGDSWDTSALGNWRQRQPKIGAMEKPCEVCGARWFKGPYLHFEDGWRISGVRDKPLRRG